LSTAEAEAQAEVDALDGLPPSSAFTHPKKLKQTLTEMEGAAPGRAPAAPTADIVCSSDSAAPSADVLGAPDAR